MAAVPVAATFLAQAGVALVSAFILWGVSLPRPATTAAMKRGCRAMSPRGRPAALSAAVATFTSGGLLTEYGWTTVCWIAFPPLLIAWFALRAGTIRRIATAG